MENLKEIYKICIGEETGDYYTERSEMNGVDELNTIKILCDDFRSRIKSDLGKERAEELIWQATQGSTFYLKMGELYVKIPKGLK